MKNKFLKFIFLGYCSKITREILNKNNIHPIIDYNNRNTKDKTKKKYLTKNELKLYIKRIYIELNKICEFNFTYFLNSEKINFYKNLFSSEHLFGNYKYYPKKIIFIKNNFLRLELFTNNSNRN